MPIYGYGNPNGIDANTGLPIVDTITVAQFTALINAYNEYWQGGTYSFDANHDSDGARRKGWGQPVVTTGETIGVGTVITAEHTNYLISQINAGLWHMSEASVNDLVIHRAPSAAIAATLYNELETL